MTTMKKTLAAFMACAMTFSMSMTAFAADEVEDKDGTADVTVDSAAGVKNPVISVSVPTDMDTYLNPLSAGDVTGSQITTAVQPIINKSEVPVKVTIKGAVEGATGVTVKSKPSEVVTDDLSYTKKDIYVEAVAVNGTWDTTAAGATAIKPAFTMDSNIKYLPDKGGACDATVAASPVALKSKAVVPSGTTGTAELITFALDKATMGTPADPFVADGLAASGKGTAAFRFMGTINPNVTWTASTDVKLHLVYSISGLGQTLYDDVVANSVKYNPTGKITNMVDTHIEKIQIKSGSSATSVLNFTKGADGTYAAPTGLTLATTKENITVTAINKMEVVGGAVVPSGITYVANTKALNVMATWVTTGPLKDKDEVEVKITFNIVDSNRPVPEGGTALTDYIIVTMRKVTPPSGD